MRIAPFFFALSLFCVSILPQGWPMQSLPRVHAPAEFAEKQSASQTLSDGVQMMSQADIVVVPMDVAVANRAELASLRDRILEAEADLTKLTCRTCRSPGVCPATVADEGASGLCGATGPRRWQEPDGDPGPKASQYHRGPSDVPGLPDEWHRGMTRFVDSPAGPVVRGSTADLA